MHTPQDFLYVPAAAAADWTHLAHHFARFGVLDEVSMPQMVYMLVGPSCESDGRTCEWCQEQRESQVLVLQAGLGGALTFAG